MVIQTVIRIQGIVNWQIWRGKSGQWIGVCEHLKLTAQAETWSEMMENIGETIDAVMKDLLQTGDLEKFLRDHGWKPITQIPRQLRPDQIADYRFDLPFVPQVAAHGPEKFVH